jgi:hypothetical protein
MKDPGLISLMESSWNKSTTNSGGQVSNAPVTLEIKATDDYHIHTSNSIGGQKRRIH